MKLNSVALKDALRNTVIITYHILQFIIICTYSFIVLWYKEEEERCVTGLKTAAYETNYILALRLSFHAFSCFECGNQPQNSDIL